MTFSPARRPLVIVEDHLFHLDEVLSSIARRAPHLLAQLTAVCLERQGPDTERAVERWLASYDTVQIAALLDPALELRSADVGRVLRLAPSALRSSHQFSKILASLLRPRGLLLQDIQLETLAFIEPARWWESIYIASTVRGLFAERAPSCRFFSNKRGYEATFGRELLEAGFDPRDVLEKDRLDELLVPVLDGFLTRAFPLTLDSQDGDEHRTLVVGDAEADRIEVEADHDLVLWLNDAPALGGRALALDGKVRLTFKPGSPEALTWRQLIEDRLGAGDGLEVVAVGRRLAPAGAGRAELTNIAARHVHILRGRLREPSSIVTADHAYRLSERLRFGLVRPS